MVFADDKLQEIHSPGFPNFKNKGDIKMGRVFDNIMQVLGWAGASNKGKAWTQWAFDLAESILG